MLFKGAGKSKGFERRLPCIRRNSILFGSAWNKLLWQKRIGIEELTFSRNLISQVREGFDIVQVGQFSLGRRLSLEARRNKIASRVIFSCQAVGLPSLEDYRKIDYVQVLAPYYELLAQSKEYDTSNLFYVPNFVDCQRYTPISNTSVRAKLEVPEDAFVVLSSGAITSKYKHMDRVIEEVAFLGKMTDQKVYLLIAGQLEPESPSVISYGKRLLGDRVIFLPNVAHEFMPLIYPSADVFVLGSFREVFGIAFLEAMASGVPAFGDDYEVTRWIIGGGGETTDMQKKGALAKILQKYTDRDICRKVGGQARERALTHFSKEKVVRSMMEVYRTILEEKQTR